VQQLIGTFDTLSPSDSDSASASDSELGTVD